MKVQLTNKWNFIGMMWLIFEASIIAFYEIGKALPMSRGHRPGDTFLNIFLFFNAIYIAVAFLVTNAREISFEQGEVHLVNYNLYGIERTKKILNSELSYKNGVQGRSGTQLILYRNGNRFETLSIGTFDKDGLNTLEEQLAKFPEYGRKKS
jgi:hypothetical protein